MEQRDSGNYRKVIESALFVSGRAMGIEEIAGIAGIGSVGHAKKLIAELEDNYRKSDSALTVSVVGEKYVLAVASEYAGKVSSLAGSPELGKGSLRILAYISRNEPVMQSSIVKAFGSATYDHMRELLDKDFVRAVRTGRTKKVETTQKFKEYFNLSR